ncbi:hypothetical protein D1007_40681 [Hordeum vulgare]|nr:hypothetical protein D1007_40681 [Hordeum vulgare]
MGEGKRQREQEVLEEEEESDVEPSNEEEVLHYEGDTIVEEPFEVEEDNTLRSEEENIVNKKQKLPVTRGPTTRSHSRKLRDVEPDFKPSSDGEGKCLLKESDDDGFEPLSFVMPKKRKSREKKCPARKWHAFDTNCKTDLVMNNLSEVFNKYILDVRKKPIRTMCDGIKDKEMVRWHRNRESGRTARWRITPHYSEKLEIEKERARYCKPILVGVNLWQVISGQQTHVVNLELQTCGCRKWNLTGIPCNHAISAINKAKRFSKDFVSTFFKKEFYLVAYEPMIFPVPGEHDWTRPLVQI